MEKCFETVYQVLSLEVDKKTSCKVRKNVNLSHLLGSQPVRNQLAKDAKT